MDEDIIFDENALSSFVSDDELDELYGAEKISQPTLSAGLDEHKLASLSLELEKKKHELRVDKAMLWQRTGCGALIWLQSTCWLIFIGGFLWFSGKKDLVTSEAVQIALITTTTINVLGLFYIVARWLFPTKHIPEMTQEAPGKIPLATLSIPRPTSSSD